MESNSYKNYNNNSRNNYKDNSRNNYKDNNEDYNCQKKSFYNELIEYSKNGRYPLHMPGHKRNERLFDGIDPYKVDITEIDGFDNLHNPKGIILDAMKNASDFFETDRTWFLVNGSSCGILAAISAVTNIGDKIIIGRNCHKAVYNCAKLRNLDVEYVYPSYIAKYGINGGYNKGEIENILKKNRDVKAVVLTSPTYDGIVSDIEEIARVVHKYNTVLIVDEAHGAHFGISEKLPVPAYKLGADLVIESTHKTLPAMTQTALLHLKGDRIDAGKVQEMLSIYETSSPSYVLMCSIDKCIRKIQKKGQQRYDELLNVINKIRKNVNKCKYISIPCEELKNQNNVFDVDVTKLIINVNNSGITGKQLGDILRYKYNIEVEMDSLKYVLGITTICDDYKELERLAEALKEIDKSLEEKQNENISVELLKNKRMYSIYETDLKEKNTVNLFDSKDCISGEFVFLYPPGIPLVVPGEVITEELLEQIKVYLEANMNISGLKDNSNKTIEVVK